MISYKIKLIQIIIFIIFINIPSKALENKIEVKLNNQIITSIDIENEKRYLIALNPDIQNLNKTKLYQISKNSLIREKIKEQEILKYLDEIELNENFLNQLLKQRYSRLDLKDKKEFLSYIKNRDLNIKNIEKKISIEALWNQIIYQKFSKKIKIDKKKLEEKISEINEKEEKDLLLSEIVFKINENEDFNLKYRKILNDISNENFESAALLHSISDSSSVGGKLGWIKQSALNKKINKELTSLKKGEITKPIFTPNGYLMLKIDDIKFTKVKFDKNAQLDELIRSSTNQQLNQQSIIYFNKIKKNTFINEL